MPWREGRHLQQWWWVCVAFKRPQLIVSLFLDDFTNSLRRSMVRLEHYISSAAWNHRVFYSLPASDTLSQATMSGLFRPQLVSQQHQTHKCRLIPKRSLCFSHAVWKQLELFKPKEVCKWLIKFRLELVWVRKTNIRSLLFTGCIFWCGSCLPESSQKIYNEELLLWVRLETIIKHPMVKKQESHQSTVSWAFSKWLLSREVDAKRKTISCF